ESFLEQLKSFSAQVRRHSGHPSNVAPRFSQAGDVAGPDWITMQPEDNGNGGRRSLDSTRLRGRRRNDDVHVEADQLGGKLRQSLGLALGIAVLDDDGLPLDVAQLSQTLAERLISGGVHRRDAHCENPDARHFPSLLRLDGEWRNRDTDHEDNRDPDPPHDHLGWDGWQESSRGRRVAGGPPRGRARFSRLLGSPARAWIAGS